MRIKNHTFLNNLSAKNSNSSSYIKQNRNESSKNGFLFRTIVLNESFIKNKQKNYVNYPLQASFIVKSLSSENVTSKSDPILYIEKLENQKTYYWNQCFDKGRLKNFVLWFFRNNGEHKTVQLVEEFKNLGFQYATKAGISLGIEDLKIPPKKASLIFSAEKETASTIKQYKRGDITGVERFQRLIDTWHRTSEQLKQEVIDNYEATDILNPVYMMAFSGARGNISQVRQLVGMRGLMSNPQGQIIDFPIRSNFREGLTLTEYIISSYGARKGIVDTALRTANAGYLTRRLVDVAQHVIISNFDCGTRRGIFLKDMKEGNKTIVSLNTRLIGRVCCTDIYSTNDLGRNLTKIAKRNQEISLDLAFEISKVTKKVFVRSALTCETKKLVCQLCYGWSLAQGNLVSIGEAIGVIAAQSIGEPGTQLTMRTFHTGGVFSGDVTDQIRMPFSGMIIYNAPIAGTLIRTPEGKIAFLTKIEGSFTVCKISGIDEEKLILKNLSETEETGFTSSKLISILPKGIQTKKFKIPSYTLLYAKNGDLFNEKEVVAQISSISKQKNATDEAELTIKAEIDGQLHINYLDLKENNVGPKLTKKENEEAVDNYEKISLEKNLSLGISMMHNANNSLFTQKNGPTNLMESFFEAWNWGNAWILSGKIYHSPTPSPFFPQVGDYINNRSLMNGPNELKYISMVSGQAKLEYLSNLLPKYLKPEIIEKSSKNHLNKISVQNNFPTLNNELLSFSLKNLTYKTIGYYIRLNESFNYKTVDPFIKNIKNKFDLAGDPVKNITKPRLNNGIQIKKYRIKKQFLNSRDAIFVIPENLQFLLNKSLLNLYPSNWQPDFKTVIQWFPSQLKTISKGIVAKEEITNSPNNWLIHNKTKNLIKSKTKTHSLFTLHKKWLIKTSKIKKTETKYQKTNHLKSISLKIICLSNYSYLENLKIKKIQFPTINSNQNILPDTFKKSIFSIPFNKPTQLNPNFGLAEQKQSNYSRLLWFPSLNNQNLLEQKVKKMIRQAQTNENLNKNLFTKIIKKVLKTKKKIRKNLGNLSLPLTKDPILKNLNNIQLNNLKSFCFFYSESLKNKDSFATNKNQKQNTSKNIMFKSSSMNKGSETKNLWVYFVPKKSITNINLQFHSHTQYLMYPGQLFPFEISFDKNLMSFFRILDVSKTLNPEILISNIFIEKKEKHFNLDNWIENKNCRYSLSTKSLLSLSNQKSQNLKGSSNILMDKKANEEKTVFVFQRVHELPFNFVTNFNSIDLKNDIYELSKISDNPLNGLNKITNETSTKINLFFNLVSKNSKISTNSKFIKSKLQGSLKLFTFKKQNKKQEFKITQSNKSLKTQKTIKKLNHLFSISPDFDTPLSKFQKNPPQNILNHTLISLPEINNKKQKKKLIINSLFNKSYLSLTLFKFFKNPFLNKQQSSLQIMSKYPNLDISLIPQYPPIINFNNVASFTSTNLIKANVSINSNISGEKKVKNEIKSQLSYSFISKALNLVPFYITTPSEPQNMQSLRIKSNNTTKQSSEKNSYKLFDYPFKDYKLSFTKGSTKSPSKIMKNYLTKTLFSKLYTKTNRNNLTVSIKNHYTSLSKEDFNSLYNNLNSLDFKLNQEIPDLIKISSFRSMLIYSLEQLFPNLTNKIIPSSNNLLFIRKSKENISKDQFLGNNTFENQKNQSFSIVKFYGTTNHLVSPLVPFAKSFSYSPFEGEIIKITSPYSIMKKEKNSLKMKLYLENKTIALQQKQHVSIFLTKNDLISYFFLKSKNKNIGEKFNQASSYFEKTLQKGNSKNYLIKDIILPISSEIFNNMQTNLESSKTSTEVMSTSLNFQQINNLYEIPPIMAGFPLSKQKQTSRKNITPLSLKSKTFSSSLTNIKQKYKTVNKLKEFKQTTSTVYQVGDFIVFGDKIVCSTLSQEESLTKNVAVSISGQIIHINKKKLTIRKGQPLFISPKSILHKLDGDFIESKSPVITLSYQRLKTGDIVQGIPKIEQFFEARTTKRGRLFRDSLPNLLKALFKRYLEKMPLEKAVRQSFYKIQQIIVDGVLRVYRSQGVTIADKHLEIIVKQMTSKVKILEGGQTGFFPGEVVDLEFVEQVNELLMKKIQYEPLVLGITKSSLEVDSFLSAASFQQTTRVLSHAAIARKKDFLKGLKENVILGNLIPAGTGYLVYLDDLSTGSQHF